MAGLYNPVYFNYGLAVHGANDVPGHPASHGCVRIPMHIAAYFPTLVHKGDTVYVFDGVKEPETYGAQPPVFDWPDPNYVTTTTTSSTTTTTARATVTTTTVPATTSPPTATTSAATIQPPTTSQPSTLAPAIATTAVSATAGIPPPAP